MDDAEELALLGVWRRLEPQDRAIMLRLLTGRGFGPRRSTERCVGEAEEEKQRLMRRRTNFQPPSAAIPPSRILDFGSLPGRRLSFALLAIAR